MFRILATNNVEPIVPAHKITLSNSKLFFLLLESIKINLPFCFFKFFIKIFGLYLNRLLDFKFFIFFF